MEPRHLEMPPARRDPEIVPIFQHGGGGGGGGGSLYERAPAPTTAPEPGRPDAAAPAPSRRVSFHEPEGGERGVGRGAEGGVGGGGGGGGGGSSSFHGSGSGGRDWGSYHGEEKGVGAVVGGLTCPDGSGDARAGGGGGGREGRGGGGRGGGGGGGDRGFHSGPKGAAGSRLGEEEEAASLEDALVLDRLARWVLDRLARRVLDRLARWVLSQLLVLLVIAQGGVGGLGLME